MGKQHIFGLLAAALAVVSVGCGNNDKTEAKPDGDGGKPVAQVEKVSSGTVTVDGSTTVYPIVLAAGEDFGKANAGVKVNVNKAGTGSGFQKFAREEIDVATASRPIKKSEEEDLKKKGIEYIEIPIAYDGVSIIVSSQNKSIDAITIDELKKMWAEDSKVVKWSDAHAGGPAQKITFYGPTSNHGTFEYFTETVCGKKGSIRKDVQSNQEYNVIVNSVAGDATGIAYVGYNYYAENKDKVKALTVNGVAPTEDTIKDGTYTPLSRPLFIYVNKKTLTAKKEVKAFVEWLLGDKGDEAVKDAKYVVLPAETKAAIKAYVDKGTTGTKFADFKPGTKLIDVYKSK